MGWRESGERGTFGTERGSFKPERGTLPDERGTLGLGGFWGNLALRGNAGKAQQGLNS